MPPQPAHGRPLTSPRVNRIAIIGCGGSGKTHLANRLAALLNVPLTHLDGVYYDADWNALPQEQFAAIQRDLVAAPRWLIEGNYAGTLPIRLAAADTVIFLDFSAVTCLAGIVRRRLRYRGGQHAQDGVYDRLNWNFVRYICGYRKTMRPRVRQILAEHGSNARLITLTSRRDADRFVAQLTANATTRSEAPPISGRRSGDDRLPVHQPRPDRRRPLRHA
jgi:adenylate kinase family enzyme